MKAENHTQEEIAVLTQRLLEVNQQLAAAIRSQLPMAALQEIYRNSTQLIEQIIALKKQADTNR